MKNMNSSNHIDLDNLIKTIRHNCDISDAKGSSIFSICGMALRLRDLNKWENHLNPWEENQPAKLVDWIDAKEQLWEDLEDQPFLQLKLNGSSFDPFDTIAINTILSGHSLFYGAGYAHSLKPTFFLAKITERSQLDTIPVLTLGEELVRDLLTIPALNQDNQILIRREPARLFLWDQMVYLKKSGKRFLNYALRKCRLPDTSLESRKNHFDEILSIQEQTYMRHEAGEISDTVFEHDLFRKIVSEYPHTPVELFARTLKDLLADTGPKGPLKHIISQQNEAGLGFYAAFQDGLFRPLFPQLRQAFEMFVSTRDWNDIENARIKGFQTAKKYVKDLTRMTAASDTVDRHLIADQINKDLVKPLFE